MFCLLSSVFCLLSSVFCLLSSVSCLLSYLFTYVLLNPLRGFAMVKLPSACAEIFSQYAGV